MVLEFLEGWRMNIGGRKDYGVLSGVIFLFFFYIGIFKRELWFIVIFRFLFK